MDVCVCVCVCVYIYVFVVVVVFYIGYYRVWNKFPCVIQRVLVIYLFYK